MHVRAKADVHHPLSAPWGETVFELVGSSPSSGNAALHSLAHIVIAPGRASSRHYHKISEETYYILSGQSRMVIDGREFALIPGQACLIQPGEWHQIFNSGEEDLQLLAICSPAWNAADSYTE